MNKSTSQLIGLYSLKREELDVDLMTPLLSFGLVSAGNNRLLTVKRLVAMLQAASKLACSQLERTISATKFSAEVHSELAALTWRHQQRLLRHGTFCTLARLDASSLSSQGKDSRHLYSWPTGDKGSSAGLFLDQSVIAWSTELRKAGHYQHHPSHTVVSS